MDQPKENNNKKTLIIILVVLGVLGLSGFVCCGASMFFGIGAIGDMEKTYYSECENLPNADDCNRCCTEKGHSGHIHGEFLNDEGKLCGCI